MTVRWTVRTQVAVGNFCDTSLSENMWFKSLLRLEFADVILQLEIPLEKAKFLCYNEYTKTTKEVFMHQGLIFAIEEFSVFDGPGMRTSVFLKGCPLSCEWCHNPEGQSFTNEILRSPNGCISCGACEANAVEANGKRSFTEASINACPHGLLRYCAKEYTPQELCEKLEEELLLKDLAWKLK